MFIVILELHFWGLLPIWRLAYVAYLLSRFLLCGIDDRLIYGQSSGQRSCKLILRNSHSNV